MRSFMYLLILEVSTCFASSNLVLVIRRESDVKPSLVGGGDIIVLAFDV